MARKPLQTYDVFVGNLPNDANERNVGKVFTPYGEIAGIIVKETSKVPPPYNKFAFVKFLCEPDAEKAVKELDKTNIQGSIIVVKKADDRKDQKKKSYGEGAGWRGFRQSDTGNLDSNAGEWTCPKLECANINFSRRTSCNLCSTPRPEGSISSDSSDVGGVVSAPGSIVEKELDTVLITHVETPITLWIQVVSDENTKKIFSITEQLIQLCPAAQPVSGQPDSGKVYACLFSEDNMWYRCQVKQNLGTDKFKIQYIDYGNTEEVTLSSLVELPASVANVKGLACKIQLHNTRAKDRSDKQGVSQLADLKCDGHTAYEHSTSIEEFQKCIAGVLEDELINKVKFSGKFSLMFDESTDVSVHQNMIMYVRVLESDAFDYTSSGTYFFGIDSLVRANADSIFSKVIDMLQVKGIDVSNLCGVSTDGAAVMLGHKSGVVTRLKNEVPGVLATHCIAHRLALSCCSGADAIPYMVKIQEILNSVYKYFHYSPKNMAMLESIQSFTKGQSSRFKEVFHTRWLSFEGSVSAMVSNYASLISVFLEENSGKALSLHKSLTCFKFLYVVYFLCDVLKPLTILSKMYQKQDLDFTEVTPLLRSTIDSVNELQVKKNDRGPGFHC